jgi:hypothetical protein
MSKKIIVLLFLLSLPFWAKFRDRDRQIKPRPSVSASPSGVITSSPWVL